MKLVTVAEMQALERVAAEQGLPYEAMMENAGRAAAEAVRAHFAGAPARAVVLVGPGNNGGDGLVAAYYLRRWGFRVAVYIWRRGAGDDPNLERSVRAGIPVWHGAEDPGRERLRALVGQSDVLLDALLGTGAGGPLRGDLPDLLAACRAGLDAAAERPWVVAVDLPSGLDADSGAIDAAALPADLTVTFACPKRGHYLFPGADWVGALQVADIGIDSALAADLPLAVATAEAAARWLPARPRSGHKGTYGRALVVAGSANYVGAPALAAEAAYRSGAGLVTAALPQRIYPLLAGRLREPTFLVLPDDLGALAPAGARLVLDHLVDYDALLVGPGLGSEAPTGAFLAALLQRRRAGSRSMGFGTSGAAAEEDAAVALPPLVLDADGLNLLREVPDWPRLLPAQCVLTPHPGEMARLLGVSIGRVQADRIGVARAAARDWGCVVALKGAYTVVAAPDGRATVIPFANALLATAGSGDVLAGVIVGLLAQGAEAYGAAICGAYLHGLAGEMRAAEIGDAGMLAGDLLPLLPLARRRLRDGAPAA